MKKKITIALVLLGVATVGLYAQAYLFSCGKVGSSWGREYFDNDGEYESFLRDLNETFCGTRDLPYKLVVAPIGEPTPQ